MRIIAGIHRGRPLARVGKASTRETANMVKEAVFSMLGGKVDGVVLDLFSGSGAYGLEALSRGADFLYAIDNNNDAIKTIAKNIETIGEQSKIKIIQKDYQKYLRSLDKSLLFDLVFLDPPYELNIYQQVIHLLNHNISSGGYIVCESKKDVILDDNINSIAKIKEKVYGSKRVSIYKKQ